MSVSVCSKQEVGGRGGTMEVGEPQDESNLTMATKELVDPMAG
jgi:hypothetical protein